MMKISLNTNELMKSSHRLDSTENHGLNKDLIKRPFISIHKQFILDQKKREDHTSSTQYSSIHLLTSLKINKQVKHGHIKNYKSLAYSPTTTM